MRLIVYLILLVAMTTVSASYCGSYEWKCKNGQCVDNFRRCDRTFNCKDGSDELNCRTCDKDSLFCDEWITTAGTSARCVPFKMRCDGIWHCVDGTDEQDCKTNVATSGTAISDASWTPSFRNSSSIFSGDSYMESVNGPLNATDLEYLFDYDKNTKNTMKKYDFNATVIVKNLIGIAKSKSTSADQFQEDIKDLVSLSGEMNDPLKNDEKAAKEQKLKLLAEKYDVKSEPIDQNTTTFSKLALLFPHYALIEELPSELGVRVWNGSCDSCGHNASSREFPAERVLTRPEFGGLIPQPGALRDRVRKGIITLHLHFLRVAHQEDQIPLRTQSVLLKWRMKKSVLSDVRRLRLLENYDVITEDGQLRSEVQAALNEVSENFKKAVFWRIIDGTE